MTWTKIGPCGSKGDEPFHGAAPDPGVKIARISVWANKVVYAMRIQYDDRTEETHGDTEKGEHLEENDLTFDLSQDKVDAGTEEVITLVKGRYGLLLDKLIIATSEGQEREWGGSGGNVDFWLPALEGWEILGFHGYWNKGGLGRDAITSIGVYVRELTTAPSESEDSQSQPTDLPYAYSGNPGHSTDTSTGSEYHR